jgi:hypothetical protein
VTEHRCLRKSLTQWPDWDEKWKLRKKMSESLEKKRRR